jgi:microcystin-dependent protein
VPTGWAICNGANGTPDLRDRFVVGAGNAYAPDNIGGTDTVTLSTANLPSHSHIGSTSNVGTDHTHAFSSTTSPAGNHGHSGTANQVSLVGDFWVGGSNNGTGGIVSQINTAGRPGLDNNSGLQVLYRVDASHSHSLAIDSVGDHTHTISGTTAGQSATHNHTFTTNTTGDNSPIDVRPRYYALAYIMKI